AQPDVLSTNYNVRARPKCYRPARGVAVPYSAAAECALRLAHARSLRKEGGLTLPDASSRWPIRDSDEPIVTACRLVVPLYMAATRHSHRRLADDRLELSLAPARRAGGLGLDRMRRAPGIVAARERDGVE